MFLLGYALFPTGFATGGYYYHFCNPTGLGFSKMALFSFGVVTDVQYADIPDGRSFHGNPRYYRHSLEALKRAVACWNEQGSRISFALQLGDLVDAHAKENSHLAVEKVLSELQKFRGGPIYHMLGNHCLSNLPRHQLNRMLGIASHNNSSSSYYSFTPHPRFRILVLDGYDISVLGWPSDHPHAVQAAKILAEKNPNENKNSPEGLPPAEQRYVMFNGGVGKQQLQWLDEMLQQATECEQKVLIACHVPLFVEATFVDTVLWNWEEVLQVIHRYQCVVACLAGHTHEGGYAVDSHGIHHRVLEAILECPPGKDSFGVVEVYLDRIHLLGRGRMASADMFFASP